MNGKKTDSPNQTALFRATQYFETYNILSCQMDNVRKFYCIAVNFLIFAVTGNLKINLCSRQAALGGPFVLAYVLCSLIGGPRSLIQLGTWPAEAASSAPCCIIFKPDYLESHRTKSRIRRAVHRLRSLLVIFTLGFWPYRMNSGLISTPATMSFQL